MLTGDEPEVTRRRSPSGCAALGFEDFVGYVVWVCERALERGCCRTRTSACCRATTWRGCAR